MKVGKKLSLALAIGLCTASMNAAAETYCRTAGGSWETVQICLVLNTGSDTYYVRVTNKQSSKSSPYLYVHINNTSTGFRTGNMNVPALGPGKSWESPRFGGKNGSYYKGVLENRYGTNMAVTPGGKL